MLISCVMDWGGMADASGCDAGTRGGEDLPLPLPELFLAFHDLELPCLAFWEVPAVAPVEDVEEG